MGEIGASSRGLCLPEAAAIFNGKIERTDPSSRSSKAAEGNCPRAAWETSEECREESAMDRGQITESCKLVGRGSR